MTMGEHADDGKNSNADEGVRRHDQLSGDFRVWTRQKMYSSCFNHCEPLSS